MTRERDSLAEDQVKEEILPDTIEAHLELIREREAKIKMKDEIPDQVSSSAERCWANRTLLALLNVQLKYNWLDGLARYLNFTIAYHNTYCPTETSVPVRVRVCRDC